MSRSTRTCEICSRTISKPELLAQACSLAGLDVIQTVEEFLQALNLGCYICQTIRDDCESNRQFRPNDAFCLLEEGIPLIKNVKCRKSGDNEDPVTGIEMPKGLHFDAILIKTADALDELYFDVEALDGTTLLLIRNQV